MKNNNPHNIVVGMELWMVRSERGVPDDIIKKTVTSVGKKYFYTGDNGYGINLFDLKYEGKEYSQFNFQMYLTKQEILDNRECAVILSKIRKTFDFWNKPEFTLEQLRAINNIIENEKL